MPKEKLIIAIDGPAGSGKSTLAQGLSKKLGYLYVDTGAMYRALTWKALQKHIEMFELDKLIQLAEECKLELMPSENKKGPIQVFIDGENVTEEIRSPLVSNHVSELSQIPGVRKCMVRHQRRIGSKGGVVLEGRDIGTVVFPDAEIKIFLKADDAIRAKRRHREMSEKGMESTLESVEKNISKRDKLDSSREHSPLVAAKDAMIIDTTSDTVDEMVEKVFKLIQDKVG